MMPKFLLDPPADCGWMKLYVDADSPESARAEALKRGYPDQTRVVDLTGDPARAHVQGDTETLLSERGKTHGDWKEHAAVTQELKAIVGRYVHKLSSGQHEALQMIAHKIGRILAGDPSFADHWDDIAGYAKLEGTRPKG